MYSGSLIHFGSVALLSLAASALSTPQLSKRATPALRLLPVGDSITFGAQSSDGNGYRLDLRNELVNNAYSVDFIGSQSDGGNNPDNQHEGFPLNRIYDIRDHMESDNILLQHPNLILIHAGTNDNLVTSDEQPYAGVGDRLGVFLDYILCESADAVLLVAKLVQNDKNQTQTDYFNSKVDGVVNARAAQGHKVRAVDHSSVGGALLADGVHPNDAGYQAMADIWFDAIAGLPAGWLTEARSPSTTPSAGCA